MQNIFATVQNDFKRAYFLKQFSKDYFDYILIDEVHKAGAQLYHHVIDYFST